MVQLFAFVGVIAIIQIEAVIVQPIYIQREELIIYAIPKARMILVNPGVTTVGQRAEVASGHAGPNNPARQLQPCCRARRRKYGKRSNLNQMHNG